MTSPLTVDHIIIAVVDRDAAADDFRSLGFTVIVGGTHTDGHTHNNLVALPDGAYLELVAPTSLEYIKVKHEDHGRHWLYVFNAGEGYAGFAFLSRDIDRDLLRLNNHGFAINGPRAGGRMMPDGRETISKGASVTGKRYPAMVQDVTPRHWRLPMTEANITHPNGVTGVAGLVALVHDLDEGIGRYRAMLAVEPQPGSPLEGARTVDFRLNDACVITIAAPDDQHGLVYDELTKRGEVPYLIRLGTTDKGRVGALDVVKTHQARIALVAR